MKNAGFKISGAFIYWREIFIHCQVGQKFGVDQWILSTNVASTRVKFSYWNILWRLVALLVFVVSSEKNFLLFWNDWKSVVCRELASIINAKLVLLWKRLIWFQCYPVIYFLDFNVLKCSIYILLKLQFVIRSILSRDYLFVCFDKRNNAFQV